MSGVLELTGRTVLVPTSTPGVLQVVEPGAAAREGGAWREGQWALDGYRFGEAKLPVRVSKGSDWGAVSVDSGDVRLPGQSGALPGRDVLGTATWTLELYTDLHGRRGPALARAALDEWRALTRVWRESALRPPGRTSALTLSYAGRLVTVYGRAGQISTPRPDVITSQGRAQGSAQFRLTDPVVYDAAGRTLDLGLVSTSDGGAVWPLTWPVTWGASSVARQGVVRVDGDAPVPFQVLVHGPAAGTASQVRLSGPGWWIDVDHPIQAGGRMVIDTRAMTVTVDGVSAAGGLSRRSRLSARLAPGDSEVMFSAVDPTGTARAVVSWQDGFWSL